MKHRILFALLISSVAVSAQQVQWASRLIDFSSQWRDSEMPEYSNRYAATQVLGYPNTMVYGESVLAWATAKSQAGKEFVTVGFDKPQMVQQVIVGETYNAGAIKEIILYDNNGKSHSVYENKNPYPVQKFLDLLTYIKIKPVYNVNKLKLVLNTDAVGGMQQIDCIGISSTTQPYQPVINVLKYSEPLGMPENLGPMVNSSYYDHLPIVAPDGQTLYFARKFAAGNTGKEQKDDIYYANMMPNGKWNKALNIGEPLNTDMHNYVCFVSADNQRIYLANKYKSKEGGVSMSTRKTDGTWSKPKALNIANYYNDNEYSSHHLSMDEKVMLMCVQRADSYGDLDIYVSFKYADGNWSEPVNVGPVINTVGAEGSVFLAADGKTIYFSSAGHQGFGSYDVYMAKRLDQTWKKWSVPVNLGPQINTPKMDIYYTIPTQGDYIYYSSELSYYGLNDLYRIKLPKEIRPEPVDMPAMIASAAKKSEVTVQPVVTKPVTAPPPVPVQPATTTTSTKDDLQQKIEELKKQQQQVVQIPVKQVVSTTPQVVVKRDTVNTIKPYEAPKPTPKPLTAEQLKAQDAIKNNPAISPVADDVAKLTQKTMTTPVNTAPAPPAPTPTVVPDNYILQEVSPTAVVEPTAPVLKKSEAPAVDEYQQKLDELKKQQELAKVKSPSANVYSTPATTQPVYTNHYPNPSAPMPATNPKADELQKKLDDLRQQQAQVGQSNTLYSNPYAPKPYDPQPVKPKQEDQFAQAFDDYQQKLDELKKQQQAVVNTPPAVVKKSEPVTVASAPPASSVYTSPTTTPATSPAVTTNAAPTVNPVISKYEEKLKKLKEEMAAINSAAPVNTPASVVLQEKPVAPPVTVVTPAPVVAETPEMPETAVVAEPVQSTPMETIVVPDYSKVLEREQFRLDSIQQAQKAASESMTTMLDKMGSSKQSLEKDIVDLQTQRDKFSEEKEKLSSQTAQLSGEKEKLELEKKKMDELIAQMQAERDKLAAEKLKMEQDKAKLELLKKQQEKEFFALKNAVDSLSKVQQQVTASNSQLQQQYDLFSVPLEVGAVAQVNNIYFVADAAFLQIPSYPELDKVVAFLQKNKNLKVEIGGHSNGLCDDAFCQKLSTSRAKTCVDYLVSKGIAASRLSYKGYGKTKLLYPDKPGNPLNQRVEIKIISIQ